MRIAPKAKCQRVLVLALWLVIIISRDLCDACSWRRSTAWCISRPATDARLWATAAASASHAAATTTCWLWTAATAAVSAGLWAAARSTWYLWTRPDATAGCWWIWSTTTTRCKISPLCCLVVIWYFLHDSPFFIPAPYC